MNVQAVNRGLGFEVCCLPKGAVGLGIPLRRDRPTQDSGGAVATMSECLRLSHDNPSAASERTGATWETGESSQKLAEKMSTDTVTPLAPQSEDPEVHAAPPPDLTGAPQIELTEEAKAELELVNKARRGDGAAFSQLIRQYEGKIFRLAMNITQNREDAEDVLQEAFLKAYEHLDQFQGNSKFYTWVVRIAVNQALMKLRKRKTDRSVSLDEQIDTGEDTVAREIAAWDPDPEVQYSQEELNTILTEAIDGLAPIYRTVFTLRDVDGLSTEETAEALELTVPAVKSRLLRARLQLRDKLTRFFKRKGDDAFAYM
jgi:RNA polymerase sigma-70 factor, ECF subfamily